VPTGGTKLKLNLRSHSDAWGCANQGFLYHLVMSDSALTSGARRHERFRAFGGYANFAEADAELRAYWHSRTPQERMEALEELRILNYGQEAIDARIPRIFGVLESHWR